MRRILLLWQIVLGLLLLAGYTPEAAAEISVEASLSHLTFAVDQRAMLSITVNGSGRHSTIELPEIEGITFSSRGQSSQISLINGSVSSSSTSNYLLQAEKPGVYTIPPIRVKVGGDTATTRPMSFEVTPAASGGGTAVSPGGSRTDGEAGFIRVSATGDHYPGEIVPVTIKAYFQEKYRTDINSLVTMTGDGVVMPPLREKPVQTREVVGGERYNVLTWETTLTGIKEGRHTLAFSLEASLLVPQKRSSRSLFGGGMFDDPMFNDPFFDSFFGGFQRQPVTVTSPQVVFNVVPLPAAGRPHGFSGAIGDFELQVTASRREVEVGEPLTLTMAISGRGNFDRVEAPVFPDSPGWKTYSPTSTFTADQAEAGDGTSGTRIFEQAIVAGSEGVGEIPALSFSYFDPLRKEYVTRTSSPLQVKVRPSSTPTRKETATVTGGQSVPGPAATAPAASDPAAKAAQPQQQSASPQPPAGLAGLAPIHLQAGEFTSRLVPLWQQRWFLAVCYLSLIVLLALLVQGTRRYLRQRHPERERRRQRSAELRHTLQRIEEARARGDGPAFLALCRNAIQNHLGPRWNMVPSAISLADLRTHLAADSPLLTIFATADAAAYGSALPSEAKMQEYLDSLRQELEGQP